MLLSQIQLDGGQTGVVVRDGTEAALLGGVGTMLELALLAMAEGRSLRDQIARQPLGPAVDIAALFGQGRFLPPLTHPDPARLHIGRVGKGQHPGNGTALVRPGATLTFPATAELYTPRLAGLHVAGHGGALFRLGFALVNDCTALVSGVHRHVSVGPELRPGALPAEFRGISRVLRGGQTICEGAFLTGAVHLTKDNADPGQPPSQDGISPQPGDAHILVFTLDAPPAVVETCCRQGDVFETEAAPFGLPLRNPVAPEQVSKAGCVQPI